MLDAFKESVEWNTLTEAEQAAAMLDFNELYGSINTKTGIPQKLTLINGAISNAQTSLEAIKKDSAALAARLSGKNVKDFLSMKDTAGNSMFTPADARAAGYTAKNFKDAKLSASKAVQAGFTAKEMHDAGYGLKATYKARKAMGKSINAKTFKNAGWTASQLWNLKDDKGNRIFTTKDLVAAKYDVADIQKITGKSANTLQKLVNQTGRAQSAMQDVTAKVDHNGKKEGGKDTGHYNATGKYIAAAKGSTLYYFDPKNKKQHIESMTTPIGELTKKKAQNNKIEAKKALEYAIQHKNIGSLINKNMKDLVSVTGIAGKTYKLKNKIVGSVSDTGVIHYNRGEKGVQVWDPSTGKSTLRKYDKEKFKKWAKLKNVGREYKQVLKKHGVKGYATGGIADYTGPAWLDGTKSKPELVLNAQDTANFIALKDVLSKAVSGAGSISNSENMTYDIDINVDHIANDYDVDKVAERVKQQITKSARYRNVTAIQNIR